VPCRGRRTSPGWCRSQETLLTTPVGRLSSRDKVIILAAWAALGLLESAKAYLNNHLIGRPAGWGAVLIGNMPWWLAWAALTPVVIALGRRVRLDRSGVRGVAVHLSASVALALLHHLVVGTIHYYTRTRGLEVTVAGKLQPMTVSLQLWTFFFSYFVLNVVTYWAALGAYYALEYHRRVVDGELRAARLEADLHQSRLDALRMELNPHFLFNTLNTIAALVERGERQPAVAMISRVGELLRTTLERGSDPQVPLERELEFLEIYLEIVATRFRDRLRVESSVPADVRRAMVPTLILQPLVENAVRHGIARRPGRGSIAIAARRSNGALELEVTDRGDPVNHRTAEPAAVPPIDGLPLDDRRPNGIGLANTRRRLFQLYGDAASLRLEPLRDGEGTVVTVSLPFALTSEPDGEHG
jgi:two-component system, LytTR family, sensor kinase